MYISANLQDDFPGRSPENPKYICISGDIVKLLKKPAGLSGLGMDDCKRNQQG